MSEIVDLGTCPWLWGKGMCGFGCHESDRCVTDEPEGGWPSAPWDATGRRQLIDTRAPTPPTTEESR